ncbi:MAG: OmpA family protein [Gammaproteobacteria bacterium]
MIPPKPKPKPAPVVKADPDPDSDGDGVPDSRDDCPGTPPGTQVDVHGCPEIPDLEGVHFEFDKAVLTSQAMPVLDDAAATIAKHSTIRVEIIGHTDSVGSDAYNQGLSERRASAVVTYLESKGVSGSRLSAIGRGESQPAASNDTKEGRYVNRRVELIARPMN